MSTYEISKSSLLSLKAEILRKQQELVKAKADNEVKIKLIKKNTPLEIKNKGIETRQYNDLTEEDEDLLKQSRRILEAKSKLYEKLSSEKLSEEEKKHNRRFLVRFDKKNKSNVSDLAPSDSEDQPDKYPESEEDQYQSDEDANNDPEQKWVDYVDCLGRTRKCLQKDLAYLMSKDEELKKSVEAKRKHELLNKGTEVEKDVKKDSENTNKEKDDGEKKNDISQNSELLSSDMRRELLRQHWEKEEEELRQKSDIHYQDILFGEARTHGVGYYGFSKDEDERAKQQEALRKLREETEQKQKKAQDLKAMREKQLTARIQAAKNRRRARLGLPPEEEEPAPAPEAEVSEEEKRKQEELRQKEEQKEKILEEARKNHVRPWDIGKEGVKEHYEMSQEEWVEKKREERPEEFAPPTSYRKEFRGVAKDPNVEDSDKSLKFTTKKSNKRKENSNNKGNSKKSEHKTCQNEGLNPYKSTSSLRHASNSEGESYKNKFYNGGSGFNDSYKTDFEEIQQNVPIDPAPIVNLCDATDFDDNLLNDYNRIMQNANKKARDTASSTEDSDSDSDDEIRGRGIEIAPPASFEYYTSGHNKRSRITPTANIQDSIEAGLKFLRQQVEQKEKSTKHPREMFLS